MNEHGGITLTALAERLGTFLSNIENGKQAPGLTTILRIARVLGCSVNDVTRAFDRKRLEIPIFWVVCEPSRTGQLISKH
jgi:transcriptional regulator with XRE-family HTH domain